MNDVVRAVCAFRKKFPKTIAFRIKEHAKVIEKHLNPGEEVIYVFCGQKNVSSFMIINSCVVALTNKRLMIIVNTTLVSPIFNALK